MSWGEPKKEEPATNDESGIMLIHHAIESIEWVSKTEFASNKKALAINEDPKNATNGDTIEALVKAGMYESAALLFGIGVIEQIHDVIHTAMAGGNFSDLDEEVQEFAEEYRKSKHFTDKYSKTSKAILKEILGL